MAAPSRRRRRNRPPAPAPPPLLARPSRYLRNARTPRASNSLPSGPLRWVCASKCRPHLHLDENDHSFCTDGTLAPFVALVFPTLRAHTEKHRRGLDGREIRHHRRHCRVRALCTRGKLQSSCCELSLWAPARHCRVGGQELGQEAACRWRPVSAPGAQRQASVVVVVVVGRAPSRNAQWAGCEFGV